MMRIFEKITSCFRNSNGMGKTRVRGLAKASAYLILVSFFLLYGTFSSIQLIFAATPIIFAATDATPQPPATFSTVQNKSFSVRITPTNAPVDPDNVIFQIGRNVTKTYLNISRCSAAGQVACTWNNTPTIFYINFTPQTFDRAGLTNYTWFAGDSAGWWNKSAVMNYTLNPAVPVIVLSNNTASLSSSGLVGYWRFSEGSGTTAFDSSGNGNTGTLGNASAFTVPTWTSGMFGNALKFNGSQFVNVSDSASLNITSTITLEAWINPANVASTTNRIFAKTNPSTSFWLLRLGAGYGGTGKVDLYLNGVGGGAILVSSATLATNTWYHIVATYDGSYEKLYINGNLDNSTAATGTISTGTGSNLYIGSNVVSNIFFNGTIDEAQIWNRALTADEIYELYQSKVNYPTSTTFTGSSCPTSAQGGADISCNLYRNMALVSTPDVQTLNPGFYYYIYNATSGQNYTMSNIMLPLNVTGTGPQTPSGSIQIYKGWNLISFPYADSVGLAGTCQPSVLTYYSWNPSTKRWSVLTGQPPAGSGFWVYSSIDCTMQYSGSYQIFSIPLSAGWNQFGTFSVSRDVIGLSGCTFSQGPFYYNTQGSNWLYPVSSLVPGNGYWVYLTSSCTLT